MAKCKICVAVPRGTTLLSISRRNDDYLLFEHAMALASVWNTLWFSAAAAIMAVLLYDLSEAGNFEVPAAFGGILLVITLTLVGIGMKLAGRDFMLRQD